jgi:hypothetical protein
LRSFKPEQKVSQPEFLAMLIRAYQPSDFTMVEKGGWDWSYNQYAYENGWIELSWRVGDPPLHPDVVSRGEVAKILTNASGRNYNLNDSIQFLLESGMSQGKEDSSIRGYLQDDTLTRAEAVAFILNVKSKLDILYMRPLTEESYSHQSLYVTPAENWKLVVAKNDEGPEIIYSALSFDSPSQGYTKVSQAYFTIKGKILQKRGEGLTINIEKKKENGFVKVNTDEVLFTNAEIDTNIELNEGAGLYRITISTDANINHRAGALKKITMFYVDYVPDFVPTK